MQKTSICRYFCFALLLLLSTGCGMDMSREPDPQVLFIALDGTGSYDHLNRAKKRAIQALEKAPPKSRVYVRWITGESASSAAVIGSIRVPESSNNPYAESGEESPKRKLARAIAEAKFPNADRTDLQGLLWVAGKRFRKYSDLKRRLLLATDLAGNVERELPEVNLKNATVQVAGFEVDPSRPRREQKWKQVFRDAGADTTVVHYFDQPIQASTQSTEPR